MEVLDAEKKYNNNTQLSVEEWALLCKSHVAHNVEKYNEDGSLKSIVELEGKKDPSLYKKGKNDTTRIS